MAITKDKKVEILGNLKGILKEAKSVAFVNFHGLKVNDINSMRSELRAKGVGYFVSKKTLAKKAISESGMSGDIPELEGEFAIAYSEDETAAPREVYEFQKKYKDNLFLLGGIFEKNILGKEGIMEIATIPSMIGLRGMFVNVINSPIQGLVVALGQIAEQKEA